MATEEPAPGDAVATVDFSLGSYQLEVAISAGPRITGLRRRGGPQMFASLPGLVLEQPGLPRYTLIGGHRLWRAPEIPEITYLPDDQPVAVELTAGRLLIRGTTESDGMRKELRVQRHGEDLVVDHLLVNEGRDDQRWAPWAITQLAAGGTAVLPQRLDVADEHGLQPNRSIVLWPYTDPGAEEFTWGKETVLVTGSANPQPMKIGHPNYRGWLGYAGTGQLFVKWSTVHDPARDYLDFGATAQVYRNRDFVELETMGPIGTIAPSASVSHREVWRIVALDASRGELIEAVGDLGLEAAPRSIDVE